MLDVRVLVLDLVGFTLYVVSWYSLLIIPVFLTAGAFQVSQSVDDFGVNFRDGISFVEAEVFGMNLIGAVLVGFILRWLARGVIDGSRSKANFVGFSAMGAGASFLFGASRVLHGSLRIVIIGIFILIVGLALCIVANSTAKGKET